MKDQLEICLDRATRISFVAADCTSASVEAARGHLAGPTAAAVLGEALACAAIAGAESAAPDEAVSLRLDCPDGPIGGFLAESWGAGNLRGYTKKKILDGFDGAVTPSPADLFGENVRAELIRSVPGRILSSGTAAPSVPHKGSLPAAALAALYFGSLQRSAVVEAFAYADDGGVPLVARAVLAECPPDGDADAFGAVREAFAAGIVAKALRTGTSLRGILKRAGLGRAEVRETRPLRFACRCSAERAGAVLAALPENDRAELAASGKTVDIYCHFCGKLWTVPAPAVAADAQ